jgi:hypothetical protein
MSLGAEEISLSSFAIFAKPCVLQGIPNALNYTPNHQPNASTDNLGEDVNDTFTRPGNSRTQARRDRIS